MNRKNSLHLILLMSVLIAGTAGSLAGAAVESSWYDSFYQYRMPLVLEAKEAGWNLIPITPRQITSAINRLEEMEYNPLWFDYNRLKVIEVDADGKMIDSHPAAGFYLIPGSEDLVPADALGKKETLNIETEKDAYYFLRFTSKGAGAPPAGHYSPTFPIGHRLRKYEYEISYVPKMLPKGLTEHEQLLLSDGTPMRLNIKSMWVKGPVDLGGDTKFVAGLKEISLKKAQMQFLANIKRPGKKYFMLYYQPVNGHHLVVPQNKHPELPTSTAKVARKGLAEKYLGNTQYQLAENDFCSAWFAETTVKLTPNTPPPRKSSSAIKITSAANEAQSFQIVLKPKKAFDFRNIKAGSLKNSKKAISASNVSFYAMEYVPITRTSFITPIKYLGQIGDALVAVTKKRLSPIDGNFVLWVTVKTPAGTPAGKYSGQLAIRGSGKSSMKIPLELEVYDFELPEFSPFRSSWGGSHITKDYLGKKVPADYHNVSSKKDVKKLAREYYDVMCENKFTPHNVTQYSSIGMDWSPPPEGYNVDKPGNYFKLYNWDFTEFNRDLKHYIDDLKVNAFTLVMTNPSVIQRFKHLPGAELPTFNRSAPHISLAWQTWREATFVGINKGSGDNYIEISLKQYDRLLLDFYGTIARNLDKHGWLDYAYILVDETHRRGFGEYLHFLRLMKSDPYTARIKIAWTLQGSSAYKHKEKADDEKFAFNGLLDIYIPDTQENYNWWEKYYFTDYDIEPTREKLWIYLTHTTRIAIDSPGINNREFGLEIFNFGGGGYLCWASFAWETSIGAETDNPWEHPWTRWGNGAMSYFYPPCKDGLSPKRDFTIIPSLRVLTYREGVDDFEYAYILEQLIKKAEAKGIDTIKAESVLKDIEKFFYSTVHWSQNDVWFLELRDRLARAIVDLKQKM